MIRRIPWFLRLSVLVTVVLAVAVSVFQSWSAGAPGTAGWTQTQWGPLGPADRDLLVKVRLAGLWEGPTGQQAMQQAGSTQVREVGKILSTQHAELDEKVRGVADQLGVLLPSVPSAQQQAWMAEISAATGSDYDRIFIQRLREAHGIVLPIIAEVRAGTRNELVREFAETATTYVTGHIHHLEGSGLVDFAGLPDPPSPGLFGGNRTAADLIVPILVFVAALLAAIGLMMGLRRRTAGRTVVPPAAAVPPIAVAPPVPALPGPHVTEITDLHRSTAESLHENTGSHRFPTLTAPAAGRADTGPQRVVETTGPRRAIRTRGGVEATGPRHAVRR